ncbi:MAG TPA: hypothetical protein VF508_05095 [Pyrinomonadaceae bacterium]|jgi:hypothetical protein
MKRTALFCILLASCLCGGSLAAEKGRRAKPDRAVTGMIYFTNNTPDDRSYFVELFAGRARRRLAAKWTEDSGYFEFKGLRPGVYYLQISGPQICLLQYEVDASKRQPERLTILGDAGCGHHQVAGLPAPRPLPRGKKR